MMRPLTDAETVAYLAGHVAHAGAVETPHGVMVPVLACSRDCGCVVWPGESFGAGMCAECYWSAPTVVRDWIDRGGDS